PPAITSALSVAATEGVPFTYQITASNQPETFSAAPLPVGLSVNAAGLISGTPTAVGSTEVTVTATNPAGSGSAQMTMLIVPQPVIVSAPVATPNPVKVNTETAFTCAGNAAGVTWHWDFGDGGVDDTNTNSPRHTYTATGSYEATATLSNAAGRSVSAK